MHAPDKNSYIVASNKVWHRPIFNKLKKDDLGFWYWVSDPDELRNTFREVLPRYIFFLHWGWYVPEELWKNVECVCFHMTDLPYGRGGSPLQNLIKAGHATTKLSALRMVDEMDAGPVYTKVDLSLAGRAEDIYRRAGELSFRIIHWLVANEPEPVPQQGTVVTFKRREPAQSRLPEGPTAEALYDHIRMLDAPTYPHAFIDRGEFRYEFTDAELCDGELSAKVIIRPMPKKEEK